MERDNTVHCHGNPELRNFRDFTQHYKTFFYLYKDIDVKPVLRKIICDDVKLIEPNQDGPSL
jgi:hypothetical protein